MTNYLTARVAAELIHHEAIVLEAYKDSVGVWTWGIGIAETSGFNVKQYIDNPQPLEVVLRAFVDMLRKKYAPSVEAAFRGVPLSEAQFAAALSFHYNTGKIRSAAWVQSFKAGRIEHARREFMNWRRPAEVIPRREAERDLFFDSVWAGNGTALVIPVRKPSRTPDFRKAHRMVIMAKLNEVLA